MANTSGDNENAIDRIFNELGSFGRYQKKTILLMIFLASIAAINIYVTMFNLAEPKLVCHDAQTNETIPSDKVCEVWQEISQTSLDSSLYVCEFDKTYYGRSLTTDWNLLCNRRYLGSLSQTFHLIGTVSAIFTGYIGDHFGRKRIITGSLAIVLTFQVTFLIMQSTFIGLSTTAKYVVYCITQVFIGSFGYSLYVSSYVYFLELSTDDHHTLFSNIHLGLYVVGELFVLTLGYTLRNFETINWIIAAFILVALILSTFFLNESPRWLISQNRFDEAEVIIRKIAETNGRKDIQIDVNLFDSQVEIKKDEDAKDSWTQNDESNMKAMLKHIFFPIVHLKKFILLACVWFSLNLLYYGVSLGVTSIDSIDPYLMYLFASIAEFLGYMICSFNDKIGRRRATMIYFTLSGIICLVIAFIPRNKDFEDKNKVLMDAVIMILLASFGKCVVSAAFNTVFLFTSQYYPTHVRNFAMIFISCCGNIGAFISPQINLSSIIWHALPYLIFSSFSLLGTISVYFLPKIQKANQVVDIVMQEFRI